MQHNFITTLSDDGRQGCFDFLDVLKNGYYYGEQLSLLWNAEIFVYMPENGIDGS